MENTKRPLCIRIRNRDESALSELIAEYSGPVLRLVRMILGKLGAPEDAEETAADVFAAVWQRIGEYDPARADFKSWVFMLTKYSALDRRRRLLRSGFTPDGNVREIPLDISHGDRASEPMPAGEVLSGAGSGDPEARVLARDKKRRLHAALSRLRPTDRNILVRRYFFEEPIADLALSAGVTDQVMYNRLWRARQALKAQLQVQGEERAHGTQS